MQKKLKHDYDALFLKKKQAVSKAAQSKHQNNHKYYMLT